MADLSDSILLREYAKRQSDSAFSELVGRHVNFVYSVAMRYVGNPADAQDVAQAVFVILARKSDELCGRSTLTGWLYETTRLTARQLLRTRTRRLIREQEAYMRSTLDQSGGDPSWHQLAPHLEEAMSRLRAADRELLALRFYENKTGEEAALLLGIGAAAGRKRTDRALEKLRQFFAKRGVSSTTAIIAGAISSNSVQAAPIGLAKTISAVAVAKGAVASTSTLTLVQGALKIMAWSKAKTAIVAGVVALLSIGAGTAIVSAIATARTAAALATMQGNWEGTLNMGPEKLRLVFRIFETNGVYRATVDSIDQGAQDIPIPKLSAHSHSIHMVAPALAVDYQATLNSDGTAMTGKFKQLNVSTLLILTRTAAPDTIATLSPEQYAPRPDSALQGEWDGTLKVRQTSLRLNLRIAETAPGTFQALMDSPDQGVMNLPVTSLTFHPPTVRFEMAGIDGSFQGNLNESDDELAGTWTQLRKKFPLKFERVQTNTPPTVETEKDYGQGGLFQIQGHWNGAMQVDMGARGGKTELRIVFNIAQMPDGSYSATLDSPDQGAKGIPATLVDFTFPNLHMELKQIGGVFEGKLENGRLSGTWHQGKAAIPLQLQRAP